MAAVTTRDAPLRAVVWMVAGCGILTINDATMKFVTNTLPLGESIFIRGMFTFLPVLAIALYAGGLRTLKIRAWKGQMARGALLGVSTFCFLESLSHMPLAEATSLVFASPILLTLLAPRFLDERVTPREWVAVMAGFAGVVLMLNPTSGDIRWVALLPLMAALGEALRDVITRKLVATESSESMLMVSVVAVNVVALGSIGFGWRAPELSEWLWLAFAGLLLGLAHYLMTDAFRYAEATLVAPFRYSGVLWALLAGFIAFGELPDGIALAGAVLVVGSGLYVLRQRMQRASASS